MRIVFLQCASDLYGSGQCLVRLADRLCRDGHYVSTVLPDHGPLEDALIKVGSRVHIDASLPVLRRKHFTNIFHFLRFLKSLVVFKGRFFRYAVKEGVDIIHTNSSIILGGGAVAKRLKVPHVTHVRESYAEFSILWPLLRWYMLSLSSRVVCVSNAMTKQFAIRGVLPDHVVAIYDGFPSEPFREVSDASVDATRQKYDLLNQDVYYIGLVGRIKWKRKGQETFVRAAARIVSRRKDCRFLMVGGAFPGNEQHIDMTIELIKELGVENQVLYLGETYDVYPLMRVFDVVVMASGLPEPFGGVTLEAMALGKPVVGTAIGGTPEQIEDGVTGILIPPSDPDAMADAIESLLQDSRLRKEMGESGRQRFETNFGIDRHYDRILHLYNDVIKETRG